jgi:hypothetical protein
MHLEGEMASVEEVQISVGNVALESPGVPQRENGSFLRRLSISGNTEGWIGWPIS